MCVADEAHDAETASEKGVWAGRDLIQETRYSGTISFSFAAWEKYSNGVMCSAGGYMNHMIMCLKYAAEMHRMSDKPVSRWALSGRAQAVEGCFLPILTGGTTILLGRLSQGRKKKTQ